MHLMLNTHNCTDYALFQKNTQKKVPAPKVEEETTLPFPEQSISQSDKSLCYIYPTKAADDILTAACCRHTAHAPVNHTAGRVEREQDLCLAEESTEYFVEMMIYTQRFIQKTSTVRAALIIRDTKLKERTNKMSLKQEQLSLTCLVT